MAHQVKDKIARHTYKSVYRVVDDLFLVGQGETVLRQQIYSIVSKNRARNASDTTKPCLFPYSSRLIFKKMMLSLQPNRRV
jgi:hypothetical protein